MGKVQIIVDKDKFTREVYNFWIYSDQIYLDSYYFQIRQTARHGWKTLKQYSRLQDRNQYHFDYEVLGEKDVEISQELKTEVLHKIMDSLRFESWEDRK